MSGDVYGDALKSTVGKIPGPVGSTAAAAIEGATIGTAVAEGAATAVGVGTAIAATAASTAAAAGTAIGVGAAIGNAIPIPGLGAAIGAVIGALVAFGNWLGSATKDTFHPSPQQAAAWLVLFHIDPSLMWAAGGGETVDKALGPDQIARLVRYFRIVAGIVPKGVKGNTGELYNPVSNDSCSNPYMCRVDPDDPLTDPTYIAKLQKQIAVQMVQGADAAVYGQKRIDLPPPIIHTPEGATAILKLLRSAPSAFQDLVSNWSQIAGQKTILDQINEEIRALRLYAGESGPDKALSKIFGDVTVEQRPGYHYVIGRGFFRNALIPGVTDNPWVVFLGIVSAGAGLSWALKGGTNA